MFGNNFQEWLQSRHSKTPEIKLFSEQQLRDLALPAKSANNDPSYANAPEMDEKDVADFQRVNAAPTMNFRRFPKWFADRVNVLRQQGYTDEQIAQRFRWKSSNGEQIGSYLKSIPRPEEQASYSMAAKPITSPPQSPSTVAPESPQPQPQPQPQSVTPSEPPPSQSSEPRPADKSQSNEQSSVQVARYRALWFLKDIRSILGGDEEFGAGSPWFEDFKGLYIKISSSLPKGFHVDVKEPDNLFRGSKNPSPRYRVITYFGQGISELHKDPEFGLNSDWMQTARKLYGSLASKVPSEEKFAGGGSIQISEVGLNRAYDNVLQSLKCTLNRQFVLVDRKGNKKPPVLFTKYFKLVTGVYKSENGKVPQITLKRKFSLTDFKFAELLADNFFGEFKKCSKSQYALNEEWNVKISEQNGNIYIYPKMDVVRKKAQAHLEKMPLQGDLTLGDLYKRRQGQGPTLNNIIMKGIRAYPIK